MPPQVSGMHTEKEGSYRDREKCKEGVPSSASLVGLMSSPKSKSWRAVNTSSALIVWRLASLQMSLAADVR